MTQAQAVCRSRTCQATLPARQPGIRGRKKIYCNAVCKRRERAAQLRQDAKAYQQVKALLG